MIKKNVYQIVLFLIITFTLTISIYANNLVGFSTKSADLIEGSFSKVQFSSALQNNDSVIVKIKLNGKNLIGYIPGALEEEISINGYDIKNGKSSKLEKNDVVVLTALYNSILESLNGTFSVDKKLERFIAYFIDFHPVNEYIDLSLNGVALDNKMSLRLIKPYDISNICNKNGDTLKGEYKIPKRFVKKGFECGDINGTTEEPNGDLSCVEFKVVGEDGCLGGCGTGCDSNLPFKKQAFTQDCFNHDLCKDATGKKLGPCSKEFVAAFGDFFVADSCNIDDDDDDDNGGGGDDDDDDDDDDGGGGAGGGDGGGGAGGGGGNGGGAGGGGSGGIIDLENCFNQIGIFFDDFNEFIRNLDEFTEAAVDFFNDTLTGPLLSEEELLKKIELFLGSFGIRLCSTEIVIENVDIICDTLKDIGFSNSQKRISILDIISLFAFSQPCPFISDEELCELLENGVFDLIPPDLSNCS